MTRPLLAIDEARALVLEAVHGRLGTEVVRIDAALDRVLAEDVRAGGDVPPFAASAMDGYAVADLAPGGPLRLVGESSAGHPYPGAVGPGEAVRISTGAAVPSGASAVLRQEDVTAGDGLIESTVTAAAGENIRRAGEDMRNGQVILTAGTRLGAAELGAAVAAGAGELPVARRPVVAVLSTGDELRAPGEPLSPGQIHNSNAPLLQALVTRSGGSPAAGGLLPDDLAATEEALATALAGSDVVVISGGVSVGPHDHVKPALEQLGVAERFWGVALQPGKPTWFGTQDRKLVFGLPGNPVSAAVTFSLFARPALGALLGAVPARQVVAEAELGSAVKRNPGRDQAVRVRLEIREGRPVALPTGAQGSHLFTSLLGADALAIVPRGEGILDAGSPVRLEPFIT
jgi:molybdopterin molybdotransferase